jgi:hypothetical protein
MLGRVDQGFIDISAMALNAAISGSIFAEPDACLVMMMTLPFGTLAALRERRKGALTPLVGEYHGRIVKVMGDGVFAVGVTFLILARRSLTSCPAPQEVHVRAR